MRLLALLAGGADLAVGHDGLFSGGFALPELGGAALLALEVHRHFLCPLLEPILSFFIEDVHPGKL